MKIQIKILLAACSLILLNGCGSKHSEGDGHEHGKEKTIAAPEKEPEHAEQAQTIASLNAEQIKAAGITLGSIEQKNLTGSIKANGALRVPNNNKANATSLYGGVIKSLNVQMGDYVRKGQVIATIENPQFIQLQEEYLTIGSRITLAEQELQRQKELNEGNAGALKNLQNATMELNTVRTRKASVHKEIQLMGINPASVRASTLRSALVVTSPINGTISKEFATIGSYVDVSSPVVEIVDNGLLHLDLQVFERDLPYIKVGQTVLFTLTNNPEMTYTAKVYNIGSSFENESKTVAVHCTVTGNKSGLIDGMNITGMVSISNVLTPAVPAEAIAEADGKYYIFIRTEKEAEAHDDHGHAHDEGEKDHDHKEETAAAAHAQSKAGGMNFEKIEVLKGTTDMGYTAITPVRELPAGTEVVVKGAFFVNAAMSNTGGHEH